MEEVIEKGRKKFKSEIRKKKYLTLSWNKAKKLVFKKMPGRVKIGGKWEKVDKDMWELIILLEEGEERDKFWKRKGE